MIQELKDRMNQSTKEYLDVEFIELWYARLEIKRAKETANKVFEQIINSSWDKEIKRAKETANKVFEQIINGSWNKEKYTPEEIEILYADFDQNLKEMPEQKKRFYDGDEPELWFDREHLLNRIKQYNQKELIEDIKKWSKLEGKMISSGLSASLHSSMCYHRYKLSQDDLTNLRYLYEEEGESIFNPTE